jgi:hypothetical protein
MIGHRWSYVRAYVWRLFFPPLFDRCRYEAAVERRGEGSDWVNLTVTACGVPRQERGGIYLPDNRLDAERSGLSTAVLGQRPTHRGYETLYLRHLTIDQAIYWFSVDEQTLTVRILAIFFGGQDHTRRMLARLLQQPQWSEASRFFKRRGRWLRLQT